MTRRARVLVVDDERGIRESLRLLLNGACDVFCAESVEEALKIGEAQRPEVALVDIRMPGRDGFECLRELLRIDPSVSVAMITAFASVEAAQEAMRIGAMGFVQKPIEIGEVRSLVARGAARCLRERDRVASLSRMEELSHCLSRAISDAEAQAELGRVTAGLAHDLASPISAVEFSVEALEGELAELRGRLGDAWPQLSDRLLTILESSRQCGSLLRVWRNLRKGLSIPLGPVRLSEVLDEVVRGLADRCAREGIELVTRGLGEELPVLGERTQMRRVLHNVVQNAIEAIGGVGGRVSINTWPEPAIGRMVAVIEDDGPGVPREIGERIFEPHFTTKAASGSSGLGLFIARQILRDQGATIELSEGCTMGAAFTISFQIAKGAVGSAGGGR